LNSILFDAKALQERGRLKTYSTVAIPEINADALAYFAVSVFWRASIHHWKDKEGHIGAPTSIGTKYAEQFRQYLLDEAEFPSNAVLMVAVVEQDDVWYLSAVPFGGKIAGFWRHDLPFLGLLFILWLGAKIPPSYREMCIVRSTERIICRGTAVGETIIEAAKRMFAR
jgi:hypothetical protein